MKNMKSLCLSLLGVLSAISVSATTLIDENFNYADGAAMTSAGWSASPNNFISIDSGADKAIGLNTKSIYYDFTTATGVTLTKDFSLTVKADITAYGNQLYVLMVSNPDANNVITGYGFLWDTSSSGSWGGVGFVQLTKVSYDLDTTTMDGNTPGSTASPFNTQAGSGAIAPTGTPTTSADFSSFVMSWDNATDTISLSVNGSTETTKVDSTYSSFSRVYIAGKFGSAYYDSVSLTTTAIPEPASFAAMAGGLGLMAAMVVRRKRSASFTA